MVVSPPFIIYVSYSFCLFCLFVVGFFLGGRRGRSTYCVFVVALFVFVLCLVTNADCVSELYSHFHVGFRERGYNNSIYNKNKFVFQQAITSYFTYDDELL